MSLRVFMCARAFACLWAAHGDIDGDRPSAPSSSPLSLAAASVASVVSDGVSRLRPADTLSSSDDVKNIASDVSCRPVLRSPAASSTWYSLGSSASYGAPYRAPAGRPGLPL